MDENIIHHDLNAVLVVLTFKSVEESFFKILPRENGFSFGTLFNCNIYGGQVIQFLFSVFFFFLTNKTQSENNTLAVLSGCEMFFLMSDKNINCATKS